jgi:hypothetical protein
MVVQVWLVLMELQEVTVVVEVEEVRLRLLCMPEVSKVLVQQWEWVKQFQIHMLQGTLRSLVVRVASEQQAVPVLLRSVLLSVGLEPTVVSVVRVDLPMAAGLSDLPTPQLQSDHHMLQEM